MIISGTKNAFLHLLSKRGSYKVVGRHRSTVSNWKKALKGESVKNTPSLDLMEKFLIKSGYFVKQEKIWKI